MNSYRIGAAGRGSFNRFPIGAMATLLFASGVLFGCSPSGPKGPHGSVHGKATVKGIALPAGTVVSFLSDSGGGAASGAVGADGVYRLISSNGEKVPVGKYKVVVMPAQKESSLTPEQQMEASMKTQQDGEATVVADDSPIPAKYQNPTTTTETHEVKEGDNEINIDLTE